MKFHDSKKLALINALVLTVIFAIFFIFTGIFFFNDGNPVGFQSLIFAIGTGLIFCSAYLTFRFTVDRFIYSKIRLVYKSIHSVKTGKKEQGSKNEPIHLEQVQEMVANWERDKLKEIEQMKGLEQYRRDFIGNLSHEMKTPLFNIQGYVSTLLDGGLEDPQINTEYLRRTEKSVDRLVKILEDLDEIAQLESGNLRLHITRFDICALAKEVVELLEMKSAKLGIQMVISDPENSVMTEGDRDKIRQVLTNIIDNSLRYGRKEHGRTKITFFDMDENILTEITDNGVGIDQQELPRVFERFYRTDQARNISRKGKGLGLAIVKHIIEAHGQTVHARSAVGVGTTFGFTLKKA